MCSACSFIYNKRVRNEKKYNNLNMERVGKYKYERFINNIYTLEDLKWDIL